MSRKKITSFAELSSEFDKLYPEFKIIDDLRSYGIEISEEDAENIKILKKDEYKIVYLDKKTGEIVTSDLHDYLSRNYNCDYSISLTKANSLGTFFVEQFYDIPKTVTFEALGKEALKARKNPNNKLLSRAYADVNTKYGDFCLVISSEYYTYHDNLFNYFPGESISLYYGNHKQILCELTKEFHYSQFCLFRWKYTTIADADQIHFGFNNHNSGPSRDIWCCGSTGSYLGEKILSPIYDISYKDLKLAGTVIMNGKQVLTGAEHSLPNFFKNRWYIMDAVKDYDSETLTSKAFFASIDELVSITKKGNIITIEYSYFDFGTDKKPKIVCVQKIPSLTDSKFTLDDIEKVIVKIEDIPISERNELKKFVINQLNIYLDLHDYDDLSKLKDSFSLETKSFEDILKYIENKDLNVFVEEQIDNFCSLLHIDVKDLLGKYVSNQENDTESTHRLVKNCIIVNDVIPKNQKKY